MKITPSSVNWRAVIFYYVIACAISWPFFYWRDYIRDGYRWWFYIVIMWGPGVAALISLYVFRTTHRRTITLSGTSLWRSVAIWMVPLIIATVIFSVGQPDAEKIIKTMAWGATMGLVVTLGEELGWRGFLQDTVRSLPAWKRYAFIGTVWALWHFTNNFHHQTPIHVAVRLSLYIPACIALSWLAGAMTDRTRSLLVACCVHAWVNVTAENYELVGNRVFVALPVTIAIWWVMLRTWPKSERV